MRKECEYCGSKNEEHKCSECNRIISKKVCEENWGLCYKCIWVLKL